MTRFEALKAREEKLLCRTYGRYPVSVSRAKGSKMWDVDGKEYLDLLSGIAVTALGHCNEELAEVIGEQAKSLSTSATCFIRKNSLTWRNAS